MMKIVSMAALLVSTPAFAQELALPALSPSAEVSQQVGVVDLTVSYSSPGKRGRTVWGELVPYGEMWRTGANMATTLEVTGDVKVGGKDVPAGKYAVFTIPGENEWTVVLNKNPNQGGTGKYDEALDLVRVKVKPEAGADRERLTFLFSDTDADSTRLDLEWAGVRVGVPVEVDTAGMVNANIERYTGSVGDGLADAARYRAEHGDLAAALTLIDASMALEQTWYNTWLKADFLHQQGEAKSAYKYALTAKELGDASESFFWKARVEKALAEWKKK